MNDTTGPNLKGRSAPEKKFAFLRATWLVIFPSILICIAVTWMQGKDDNIDITNYHF